MGVDHHVVQPGPLRTECQHQQVDPVLHRDRHCAAGGQTGRSEELGGPVGPGLQFPESDGITGWFDDDRGPAGPIGFEHRRPRHRVGTHRIRMETAPVPGDPYRWV